MTSKKSNYRNEVVSSSLEPNHAGRNWKNLIIFALKRVIYYLTILHGAITIIFLIYLIPVDNLLMQVRFYLTFSLVMFLVYGVIIFLIHLLEKSYLKLTEEGSLEGLRPITKINRELAENLLQGKTLQVYWYIFTHNHAGIREIQKALKFTSSGTVSYQISKLLKGGLISKDNFEGKYKINQEIKIGVLKFYIRIRSRMVPRISLYLIIFVLGFTVFLLLTLIGGFEFVLNPLNILLLLFLIVGIIIFLIESVKISKLNPIK
jgi:DNA-binding transcriptional ArsR family regulator